eukprot:494211-Amphidinium_carterae.1
MLLAAFVESRCGCTTLTPEGLMESLVTHAPPPTLERVLQLPHPPPCWHAGIGTGGTAGCGVGTMGPEARGVLAPSLTQWPCVHPIGIACGAAGLSTCLSLAELPRAKLLALRAPWLHL